MLTSTTVPQTAPTVTKTPFILRLAKFFSVVGALFVLVLGIIGMVSCFYNLSNRSRHFNALCVGSTAVAIVAGLIILGTEASRYSRVLNNTLARAIVWIILIIVPFWGWWSWLGSCLVLLGALTYIVAFLIGYTWVHYDKIVLIGNQGYYGNNAPAGYYEAGQGQQHIQINNPVQQPTIVPQSYVSQPYNQPHDPVTTTRPVATTPVATNV